MEKFPTRLLNCCREGKKVFHTDRLAMVATIADYMLYNLKTCSRSVAQKIASEIVAMFPASFEDKIGGQTVGQGMESLRTQIYNSVNYRKDDSLKKRRKAMVLGNESYESQENTCKISRRRDEYRCVEYETLMPKDETLKTLEEKRVWMVNNYFQANGRNEKEVQYFMNITYYLQRAEIIKSERNLIVLFERWTYLKKIEYFLSHSSRLLGQDLIESWQNSILNTSQHIRKYFKTKYSEQKRINGIQTETIF